MHKLIINLFYKKTALKFILRHPIIYSVGLIALLIPSLFLVQKLKINSDFKFLLPQSKPSVLAMNLLKERRQESTQLLSLMITSPDRDTIVDVIESLVPPLQNIDKQWVKKVNYSINDAKAFYEDNKYLYLELEDIKTIHQRLDAKIKHEKLKQNPLFFDLEDKKVEFDISDIENKYNQQSSNTGANKYKPEQFYKGYFFSKRHDFAIIVIQPSSKVSGIANNERLIKKVEQTVNQTLPPESRKNYSIDFTGSVYETVYEYKTLIQDMASTLGLCLSMVFLIVLVYFFNFRTVFFLVIPLIYSVALLLGISYFCFDFLNSITVFLMSIIIGNGVNTGILLLSAYFFFLKSTRSKYKAFSKAVNRTIFSTFFSAFTTSLAFLCLYFSQINSLKQFGVIGCIGIFLAWLCNFLILPIFVFHTSMKPTESKSRAFFVGLAQKTANSFTTIIQKTHIAIAIVITLFIIGSLQPIFKFIPNSLEYNFSKLRNKTQNPIFGKANNVFKEVSPTIVLFDGDNKTFCSKIKQDIKNNSNNLIDRCESIYDYIPDQQTEKLKELGKIKTLLNDKSLNFLSRAEKKKVKTIKKNLSQIGLIKASDLPSLISNKFKENDTTFNTIAYLYPQRAKLSNNSKNLVLYTQDVSSKVSNIGQATVAGQSFILADLISAIKDDAPKTTSLSLLLILVIITAFLKRKLLGYMILSVLFSFITMLFCQVAFDIKYNFINFVALPISFGIGIDYAINFFYQLSQKRSDLSQIIQTTGSAIIVCSMTTIVSYLSLMSANSQALGSFGKLALIGEFSSLLVVFVALPSYYFLFNRKKKKAHIKTFKQAA